MEDEEESIRDQPKGPFLEISKEDLFMVDNIDSFVALSRDNTSIDSVELFPFDSDPGNYEFWDKVGRMVGNLTELDLINISFLSDPDGNDATMSGMKPACLTGRYSLEACGIYGVRLFLLRHPQRITNQRVKKSKASLERFTAIP